MSARITPAFLFAHARYDLATTFSRLARFHNTLSSGKEITSIADSPPDALRVLDLHVSAQRLDRLRGSVLDARGVADSQASLLQNASTVLTEARARALEATSGANSQQDLEAIATDLDGMLDQLLAIANDRSDDRFTFAGSRVTSLPFAVRTGVGDEVVGVDYAGDDLHRSVRFGPNDLRPIDLSGADAFLRLRRGPTRLAGVSGLVPVPGASDTIVGDARIVVKRTATDYGDGTITGSPQGAGDSASGLRPGANAASDTIVGAHKLTITSSVPGPGGTIRLDGGPEQTFTGTETDFVVDDTAGGVVHVDLSAITAGFNGTIEVRGQGTIGVDGGPPQAITFTANQTLDSGDGRVVHVDTRGARLTGETLAVFPGTTSVFEAMIRLRDDIRGSAGFGSLGLAQRIQARAGAITAAQDEILVATGELGARSAAFERADEALERNALTLEDQRASIEDVDVGSATLGLAQAETAYQAALAAAARITRVSLLNYL